MPEQITPPRRWFSFSLQTLFVVVTIFCFASAWLISESRIVTARRAIRQELENRWDHDGNTFSVDVNELFEVSADDHGITWIRCILGDKSLDGDVILRSDEEMSRV